MTPDRRGRTAYWLVGYTYFMLIVGTTIPSPLYETYRRTWHFSAGIVTLIFAIYVIILIPSLLLFGQTSDQIGRRKIIAVGLVVAAAGTLCFVLASGLFWLFLARGLQGLAVGMLSGAITAALVELHPRRKRQAAALIASLATVTGAATGTLLAGILAQYGPWPLILSYLVQLGLLIPAFVAVWIMPETLTRQEGETHWHLSRPTVPAAIRLPFALGSTTSFLAWAVAGLFLALVPTYLTQLLHLTNLALTGAVLFLLFGASALTQIVLRRLSQEHSLTAGVIMLLIGLACVVLAVPTHALLLLLVGACLVGIGHGLAWMGSLALINLVAPDVQRADVLSGFYVATYVGTGLPVMGVGFLAGEIGLFLAVLVFACAMALAGGVLVALLLSKRSTIHQFATRQASAANTP